MGGLAAAPEIAETVELMTAPPEREWSGSIFHLRELQPTTFSGVETPLQADQWIVDMDNLLRAAHPTRKSGGYCENPAQRCGQGLVAGRRAQVGEAGDLESFLGKFLCSVLPCNCSKRDGAKIYRAKARGSDSR